MAVAIVRKPGFCPIGFHLNKVGLGSLWDHVEFIAGEGTACEVEGWAEIAGIGEVYEGDGFTVEIEDD